ncbi:MAG TPA: hypothetical protein VHN77_01295 [Phycisphaerales bacterium]|nr:hypothetical protein [Phycisphaerales bacterium]
MDQAVQEASDATPLVAFLAHRDVPCPRCNYNLRGNTSAACPECACPLIVGVKEDLPAARSVMLPVVFAAFAAALAGLMYVAITLRFKFGTVNLGGNATLGYVNQVWTWTSHAGAAAFLVAGLLALAAVRNRRITAAPLWVMCWVQVALAVISAAYVVATFL